MFRIAMHSRLFKSTAFTLLVVSLAAAQALQPAGARRPATVPEDFVITPYGYFHPSCVAHLAKGDVVRQDEKTIRHADGSFDNIQQCAYPHFEADGTKVVSNEQGGKEPSIGHAWVEYAGITSPSSSYGYMYASWNVPPAPSNNDGQTVYLFPGMEDFKDVVTIIQPVLGWNSDYASSWGIASWNCCASGTVFEATPAPVNSGDVITGFMFNNCAAGTLSCPSWDILTVDETTGAISEMVNTSSQGQTFNWAFAGALEVYNIAQCGDYPSNGAIGFYNINLFTDKFVKIANPGFSATNLSSGLTPQCGYSASVPRQATLTY